MRAILVVAPLAGLSRPASAVQAGAVIAPGVISTDSACEMNAAFSHGGSRLYFSRCVGERNTLNCRVLVSRQVNGEWQAPVPASFTGSVADFDHAVSSDGSRDEWGEPEWLGPPISTDESEYFALLTPSGDLVFSSIRAGGMGRGDPADARAHFLAVLARIPRRPPSLWGLARAQVALGDSAAAVTTLRELGGVWAEAHPESTRMQRFRTLLETLDSPPEAEERSFMQSLEEEVARVAQDMLATVRARDIERMMSFYDSVAGFVHYENGREVSWQELAPQMRQFLGAAARIELHWEGEPHVVILGPDAALVRGIHSFEGTLQDGTVLPPHRGTWTGILRRAEGRWRLIHSHSSEPGG